VQTDATAANCGKPPVASSKRVNIRGDALGAEACTAAVTSVGAAFGRSW